MPGRVERAPVVVVLDERLDLAFEVAGSGSVPGPDPEVGLSRSKSRQQRSVQARKPVNSEQGNCSLTAPANRPTRGRKMLKEPLLGSLATPQLCQQTA